MAAGTFRLDFTAQTIKNGTILTEDGGRFGGSYTGSPADNAAKSFGTWDLKFYQYPGWATSVLHLKLRFGPNTLLSIPPQIILGSETLYSITCHSAFGFCGTRPFHDGEIKTLTVATTPVPAAVTLFMTALTGLGFFGWRRNSGRLANQVR